MAGIIYLNASLFAFNLLPADINSFHQLYFKIGINSNKALQEITIKSDGQGLIKAGNFYVSYQKGQTIHLTLDSGYIKMKLNNLTLGRYKKIIFYPVKEKLQVSFIKPILTSRIYEGYTEFHAGKEKIKMITSLTEDDYLTDVLCAEAGMGQPQEYYRVQALISRTWAYSRSGTHLKWGYNFCDAPHCQAYNGYCDNQKARNSVIASRGLVITDKNNKLITATYHANCGGKTANSEDVWGGQRTYLKAVTDPYCLDEAGSNWELKIPEKDWITYLEQKTGITFGPEHFDFNFKNTDASLNYVWKQIQIPMNQIKNDLNFKSDWFSIEDHGDELIIKGRGMGHRAGICQQGAKVMTNNGLNAKEVISFYYADVKIQALSDLKPTDIILGLDTPLKQSPKKEK